MTRHRSQGETTLRQWLTAIACDAAIWCAVAGLYLWSQTPARGGCVIDPNTGQVICDNSQQQASGWMPVQTSGWPEPWIVWVDGCAGSLVDVDGVPFITTCAHKDTAGNPYSVGDTVPIAFTSGEESTATVVEVRGIPVDVAIMQINQMPSMRLQTIAVTDAYPRQGEVCTIYGFPMGSYRKRAAPVEGYADNGLSMQLSGPGTPGESGGPIIDPRGYLCGVVSRASVPPGCMWCCPAPRIREAIRNVRSRAAQIVAPKPRPQQIATPPIAPVQPATPPIAGTPIEPVIPPPAINLPPKTPSGIPSVVGDVVPAVADGFKYGPAIAAAAGIGGPIGIGIAIAGGLIGRRIKTRVVRRVTERFTTTPAAAAAPTQSAVYTKYHPVAVDSPPPPQVTATETHYVPVEQDRFRRAHDWAKDQIARKYPGATDILSNMDSLINQQLAGQRN